MFRKRRRPTPHFKVPPPYNPLHGEQANLRQEGTAPYCAMMQVAATDTYDNYVICRGFDTRMLKFVDYAEGNPDKPGISVAKPFGKRTTGTYEIGQIYPALLPTQGNAEFTGFRQVTYTPPSPVGVNWRVGQNPGVVEGGGGEGGQPEGLSDTIGILYDHNSKVVNWLLIDNAASSQAKIIEYTINSVETATDPHYAPKKQASVFIHLGPPDLIGETVDVIDHSGQLFDIESMNGYTGWAWWTQARSMDTEEPCETLTPLHWAAFNRVCEPNQGTYRECEEEEP